MTVAVEMFQVEGGMMFPDRATLYITAIEDRQYKEEKINCKLRPVTFTNSRSWSLQISLPLRIALSLYTKTDNCIFFDTFRVGQCLWFRYELYQESGLDRTSCRFSRSQTSVHKLLYT